MSLPVTAVASVDSMLEIVRQLGPMFRESAPQAEHARRLPDEVAAAMRERGLYRLWRPRAFGGLEVDPISALRIFEEVSRYDSAAAWNLGVSCSWDTLGAWFPDAGAREVFGHPDTMLAGAFFPPRRAVAVDGGYRVTGQTSFVSGAHQGNWLLGLAHIFDGDKPRVGEHGQPVGLVTACPREEATILDTWHTLGMRGTGSHDVVMTDVFVPERRAALFVPLEMPGVAYTGPLYRCSIWPSVGAVAAPAMGIARTAIDDLLELACRKAPAYTAKPLKDRSVVQSHVAEAEATLGAARAYVYETLRQVWDQVVEGQTITLEQKTRIQLAATHAVTTAAHVVDLVHAAAGATGIRNEYRFQRYFRDVHTITQHAFISGSRYESAGQLLLGLETDWPFFSI